MWSEFDFVELTINQRQIGDKSFSLLLERLRIGALNDEDVKLLRSRLIPRIGKSDKDDKINSAVVSYLEKIESHPDLVAMFPLTHSVDLFNNKISEILKLETISLFAVDRERKSKESQVINRKHKMAKKKTSETAGLEYCLVIGVGSRVMLRRNLGSEYGLANGAIGEVIGFIQDKNDCDQVEFIEIKFKNMKQNYKLKRISCEFQSRPNQYITRSQFPISLAWALTIHKVQGLSLDSILIDIGSSLFEEGMAYVALSRARLLKNVFIVELDTTKLSCSNECIREYNRLREKNNGK